MKTLGKTNRVSASAAVKQLVSSRSGGYCAFPNCTLRIVLDPKSLSEGVVTGEIAHIAGEKPTSARYDLKMSEAQRNGETNLIMLCRAHHREIDSQAGSFTVNEIQKWKRDHEQAVRRTVGREMAALDFKELGEVASAFLSDDGVEDRSLSITHLREKIAKNDLGPVKREIEMGLSRANVFHDFISLKTKSDLNFGDRLKYGFQKRYSDLKYEGLSGDVLFLELIDIARKYSNGRIAGPLTIVTALLEACDLFER